MSVRYHLRYQIAPEHDVDTVATDLATFCRKHAIEEVVLFYGAEMFNNGLLSAADEDRWFDTIRRCTEVFRAAEVTCSLNPWMTVLHTDRGRSMPADRSFAPMVSPAGEIATAVASFADQEWREYIANQYGRFAELGFRVVWVEDDYRFHNHAPLTWGGGFEPEMVARFSEKVGRSVTREQIIEAVLKPGEPHPWRAIWMETWRECHLEVAHIISQAVEERAPNAAIVGLMSSHPSSHSIEGRDWQRLFDAFTVNEGFAHRPHFAGYSEGVARGRSHSFMMLDLQRRYWADHIEIAPEIENFPFTAWNKSDTQTWSEMTLSGFYGADAMFLDLMPFSGTQEFDQRGIGALLDQSQSALAWIGDHFDRGLTTRGVGLPWREDAAERVHTSQGESIDELSVHPFDLGHLLLPYGIPVTTNPSPVNAVFGRMAWVHDDDSLRNMLAGGLILDGEAAEILCKRGYSEQIGIQFAGWFERDTSLYSVELVVSPVTGITDRATLDTNLVPRVAHIEPIPGATEWTSITTPTLERLGAGIIAHRNRLGGRVVTFAAPNPASLPPNYIRQTIVHRVVQFAGNDSAPEVWVTGTPHLMPIEFVAKDPSASRRIVVVYNGSTDAGAPIVHVRGASTVPPEATLLAPLSEPTSVGIACDTKAHITTIVPSVRIPSQGYLVLEWR